MTYCGYISVTFCNFHFNFTLFYFLHIFFEQYQFKIAVFIIIIVATFTNVKKFIAIFNLYNHINPFVRNFLLQK